MKIWMDEMWSRTQWKDPWMLDLINTGGVWGGGRLPRSDNEMTADGNKIIVSVYGKSNHIIPLATQKVP